MFSEETGYQRSPVYDRNPEKLDSHASDLLLVTHANNLE